MHLLSRLSSWRLPPIGSIFLAGFAFSLSISPFFVFLYFVLRLHIFPIFFFFVALSPSTPRRYLLSRTVAIRVPPVLPSEQQWARSPVEGCIRGALREERTREHYKAICCAGPSEYWGRTPPTLPRDACHSPLSLPTYLPCFQLPVVTRDPLACPLRSPLGAMRLPRLPKNHRDRRSTSLAHRFSWTEQNEGEARRGLYIFFRNKLILSYW